MPGECLKQRLNSCAHPVPSGLSCGMVVCGCWPGWEMPSALQGFRDCDKGERLYRRVGG